jgi:calcium-dependent protein kinase
MDRETITQIGNVVNTEDNDEITYRDFIAACLPATEYLLEENLKTAFSYFDIDGDGQISKSDLSRCLGTEDEFELIDIIT